MHWFVVLNFYSLYSILEDLLVKELIDYTHSKAHPADGDYQYGAHIEHSVVIIPDGANTFESLCIAFIQMFVSSSPLLTVSLR